LWSEWNIFKQSYLEGLEITFITGLKSNLNNLSHNKHASTIQHNLETYEDGLIDKCTKNNDILNYAKAQGVPCNGDTSTIISKLLAKEEYKLIIEYEKV
jgi:hypothetical protein